MHSESGFHHLNRKSCLNAMRKNHRIRCCHFQFTSKRASLEFALWVRQCLLWLTPSFKMELQRTSRDQFTDMKSFIENPSFCHFRRGSAPAQHILSGASGLLTNGGNQLNQVKPCLRWSVLTFVRPKRLLFRKQFQNVVRLNHKRFVYQTVRSSKPSKSYESRRTV